MHSMQVIEWGRPLVERSAGTPSPTGAEVLLKVESCGVCHTDLHVQQGYFDLGDRRKIELEKIGVSLPHTLGHEIVGTVAAKGPEATEIALGDRRVVYPWIGCGMCAFCARGEELLCATMRSLGTRTNGGFADYVMVPHSRYLLDVGDVPSELACIYSCSGLTAYSAVRKLSGLPERDLILIVGAGGVGLNAVILAGKVLRRKVVVADVDAKKRADALDAGALAAFDNSDPGAVAALNALTASKAGVGGVIDFVGNPATAQFGLAALRKGGTLVVVGMFGGAMAVPLPQLVLRQITVRGSYVGSLDEMRELMGLVKLGMVPPIPVTTRPLSDINLIFDEMREGRVSGRVVVQPDRDHN